MPQNLTVAECDSKIINLSNRAWHLAVACHKEHKQIPVDSTFIVIFNKLLENCVARRGVEYNGEHD
jgi:hypothetical protein